MSDDIAIRVQNLSKIYRIGAKEEVHDTFVGAFADWLKQPGHNFRRLRSLTRFEGDAHHPEDIIWALRDVSFEVKRGDVVGIIGHNGAGKSTLLKILSRITHPTTGRVELNGRVSSLLEVGTGFHPELTGRENIYLNGTILGMRKTEIDHKFDEIVNFSGVEKFIDTPVKRYSSGMKVRLAFSVAAHLEPEILLVDEVLAVGDIAFQKKCIGKMEDVAAVGRTVLFVSHNMGAISQLCPTSIWLNDGQIRECGATVQLVRHYVQATSTGMLGASNRFQEDERQEMQLRGVKIVNDAGEVTQRFSCDEPVHIQMMLQVREEVPGLYGYLQIAKMDNTVILVSDSIDLDDNPLDGMPLGWHQVVITIPARSLGPEDYTVYLNFASRFGDRFNIDSPGIVGQFSLTDMNSKRGDQRGGFFSTLLNWRVQGGESDPGMDTIESERL